MCVVVVVVVGGYKHNALGGYYPWCCGHRSQWTTITLSAASGVLMSTPASPLMYAQRTQRSACSACYLLTNVTMFAVHE